jgi:RimJ/RimL family protein N-acetyltransferase
VRAVVLEPLGAAHLGAVEGLVNDADVRRFTRVPDPPPTGFVESWFAGYEEGRRQGTREMFAIVEPDGGRFLGIAVAPTIDHATRTAELGYVVAAEARGRGVASDALRQLSEWAFSKLGMERLELLISVDNEGSKRVAARCGYVREGVLRSRHFKGDLREDTELWSLLPGDLAPRTSPA